MIDKEELQVKKIKNGTVIDHINAGNALSVIRILGLSEDRANVISALMNVKSKKLGKKDIVKIENKELKPAELDKVALFAPNATINIIRDYVVIEKKKVRLPRVIKGIIKCANPFCISRSKEPIEPTFLTEEEKPLMLRCHYCNRRMQNEDLLKQF